HDEHVLDAEVVGALLHLGGVVLVRGLALVELVDVLDAGAAVLLGDLGEVERIDRLGAQAAVQRPLGQRDLERLLALGGAQAGRPRHPPGDGGGPEAGEFQEATAIERGVHGSVLGGGWSVGRAAFYSRGRSVASKLEIRNPRSSRRSTQMNADQK